GLEVQAVQRHDRRQHVLAQCQFAQVGRRAVGDGVAASHAIAHFHDRTLVDVGVLVRTGVLDQVVDVDTDFTSLRFLVVHADHHAAGVDVIDDTATGRLHGRARVDSHGALDAGTDEGFLRT